MKLIGKSFISMGHGKYHGYVTNNQRLYDLHSRTSLLGCLFLIHSKKSTILKDINGVSCQTKLIISRKSTSMETQSIRSNNPHVLNLPSGNVIMAREHPPMNFPCWLPQCGPSLTMRCCFSSYKNVVLLFPSSHAIWGAVGVEIHGISLIR